MRTPAAGLLALLLLTACSSSNPAPPVASASAPRSASPSPSASATSAALKPPGPFHYTTAGDKLSSEQVLLDNIPGGTCYHYGGRIKFGPDGLLYISTGEGFVAARAADRNNLSGKILRMHDDGSGQELFAWGFRNPQ